MSSNSLQNKKIVISGGASGIGWATTKICVAKGASVYLCDIDNSALNKIKKHPQYNKKIFAANVDASKESAVIKFFKDLINVQNINCYSNEGNVWKKSDIHFISKNELVILLKEKFQSERGRINCSLWEEGGKWRWLGIQYVVEEY